MCEQQRPVCICTRGALLDGRYQKLEIRYGLGRFHSFPRLPSKFYSRASVMAISKQV